MDLGPSHPWAQYPSPEHILSPGLCPHPSPPTLAFSLSGITHQISFLNPTPVSSLFLMGTIWNTILIIKEPFVVHGHPAFAVQSGPMDPVQGWIKAHVLWPGGGSRTQNELEGDLGRERDPERFGDRHLVMGLVRQLVAKKLTALPLSKNAPSSLFSRRNSPCQPRPPRQAAQPSPRPERSPRKSAKHTQHHLLRPGGGQDHMACGVRKSQPDSAQITTHRALQTRRAEDTGAPLPVDAGEHPRGSAGCSSHCSSNSPLSLSPSCFTGLSVVELSPGRGCRLPCLPPDRRPPDGWSCPIYLGALRAWHTVDAE